MPRWVYLVLAILGAVALVPFACVAASRGKPTTKPRIHLVSDMDRQPRFEAQQRNPLFADGRAARPPVPGSVARGSRDDDPLLLGRIGDDWVGGIPIPVTAHLMRRGQERYEVFCSPCHGLAGYGDGIVGKRAERLEEGTWVPPLSFHSEPVRGRSVGEIYDTIAGGIRSMPAYGPQIPVEDRWGITAYVRALQRSQGATIEDVPPELRRQFSIPGFATPGRADGGSR